MKKFSGARFREICDKADMAVDVARRSGTQEERSSLLSAVTADGEELFTWDHDRRVWLAAIICNTTADEVIPFVKRRDCLHQLIAEHSEELEPEYIRPSYGGSIALHPAVYHAAGIANVIDENEIVVFDYETFKAALTAWPAE
jgi:hypothetical protein